jgi:2-keto-4-pentenoate hydratase/2-oxohepta-3-ene-1,7-dioic acid hydratase in catechol pathway
MNGERRQSSTTAQLIFPVDHLIEYITFVMTLEPGDIISTGTPSGVGALKAGDIFTVNVDGVGELTNPIEDE